MTDPAEIFSSVPEPIQRAIGDLGWSTPTPVQARVIPLMIEGHDLIVQAHTGSGKTGAFGIPIAAATDPDQAVCQALVLAPTRELANQVAGEIATLGRHKGVRTVPIYGGVGYAQQLEAIEAGAHVVVGTPGRILDHLGSGRLSFDDVKTVVFDEADELLSLGFWPDMREIRRVQLPEKTARACLFSATIPERVRSLSAAFSWMTQSVRFALRRASSHRSRSNTTTWSRPLKKKKPTSSRIIEDEDPESAIIFCNTKGRCALT